MKGLFVLLVMGAVLLAGGCSQVLIQSDFDPSANFSALKTYAWYEAEQPKTGDIRLDNPMLDAQIRASIEKALNAREYNKVDADPDFQLVYHVVVSKELEVTTTSTPVYPSGYYGWRYVAAPVWVERPAVYTYDQGTLIVDVIDARNQKMVWRGSIQAELNRTATPEQRAKRLDAAVTKMIAEIPSGQTGTK